MSARGCWLDVQRRQPTTNHHHHLNDTNSKSIARRAGEGRGEGDLVVAAALVADGQRVADRQRALRDYGEAGPVFSVCLF